MTPAAGRRSGSRWADFSLRRYRPHLGPAALLAALVTLAAWRAEVNLHDLVTGLGKGLSMLGLFFPPAWDAFPQMIHPALVTVLIAATATPIGALCSIACGLAAAQNVAPGWLRTPTRAAIALERGIPEIVILLILVAAFGIGPFPGVV